MTLAYRLIRRYLPAEIISTLCTLSWAYWATSFGNVWQQSLAATIVGVCSFYGVMLLSELKLRSKSQLPMLALADALCVLVIEFGPAELLDSLLIRPVMTYWALQWSNHAILGVLLGKLLADAMFYCVAGLVHSRIPVAKIG